MRDRNQKSDVAYEAPMVMKISKFDHSEDERHNKQDQQHGYAPKKVDDENRSSASLAFERRWNP